MTEPRIGSRLRAEPQARARTAVRPARSTKPTPLQGVLSELVTSPDEEGIDSLRPEPVIVEDDAPYDDVDAETLRGDEDDVRRDADDEAGDPDPANHITRTVQVDIAFWGDDSVTLSASVREFPISGDAELDHAARLARERLDRLAGALGELQRAAIVADTREAAFRALRELTQEELGRRVVELDLQSRADRKESQYATDLSRNRHRLVQIRSGLVPIEFFWWADGTTALLLDMWDQGYRQGTADHVGLRERIAERYSMAANSVSKHEVALRAVRSAWPVVRSYRDRWPQWSVLHLSEALGLGSRGRSVVRLAICGALEAPQEFAEVRTRFAPGLRDWRPVGND